MLLANEQSVFDLNKQIAERLADGRSARLHKTKSDFRAAIRKAISVSTFRQLQATQSESRGKIQRDGYSIEKLVLQIEPGIPLPALFFVPDEAPREACLYLHGDGKAADAAVGGPIERRVKQGQMVLAVDLPGIGETSGDAKDRLLGANWKEFYLAYLLGRSIVSLRTEAALASAGILTGSLNGAPLRPIHLVGIGEAAIPALHAAALQPDAFASVTLQGAPQSWSEIVAGDAPANQLINTIHGVLRLYDLPDLLELCGKVNAP